MYRNYAGEPLNTKITSSLTWERLTRFLGALFVSIIFFLPLKSCSQPPKVSATQSSSSGYISEIGFVDVSTPLRSLKKPVSLERNGITLTIVKGVADAEHVGLLYEADGFYPDADVDEAQFCQGTPKLRLSDDTELLVIEGTGHVWESEDGYSYRMVFPHLYPDGEAVTLEIPCLIAIQPGNWPQNWQIHFQFDVMDDFTAAPVVELPNQESPGFSSSTSDLVDETETQKTDIPRQQDFGIELQIDWPLTMTMDAGIVDVLLAEPVTFQFDPGDVPQPGQVWDLNLDFQMVGYALEVLSVEAVQQSDNLGFRFAIQAQDGVVMARVMDMQNSIISGGGGGGMPQEGTFTTEIFYDDKLPNEPITVSIVGLLITSNDPWQLSWTP